MIDKIKALNILSGGRFNAIDFTARVAEVIPSQFAPDTVRRRLLDIILNIGIPFNRWLGMKITEFGPEMVVIESPPAVLRGNHVGTAHACAIALLGEFPAGLVVAQTFPLETYRMIIGKLEVEYKKAGRGKLFGVAKAPDTWPELKDEECWVPMVTEIHDESGNTIAVCHTRWQVKSWKKITEDRQARAADPSEISST